MKRFGLIIAGLCLAFCAYYFALYQGLKRTLTQAPALYAQQGTTLTLNDIDYSGFPLNVRANLTSPQAEYATGSIRAETLMLSASVLNPTQWTLHTKGDLRLDMKMNGGKRYLFDISPSLIRGVFDASFSGELTGVRLTGFKLTATPVIGQAPPIRAIDELSVDISPSPLGMIYTLNTKDIFLDRESAKQWQRVFGPHIHHLKAKGTAKNLKTLSDLSVSEWKKDGSLNISDSELLWGETTFKSLLDLNLKGSATSGEAVLKLREPEKLIKTMVETGLLDSGAAMMAQFLLMAAPRDEEGLVELPLPIENGAITFLGQRLYP